MRDYDWRTPDDITTTGHTARLLLIPNDPWLIRAISGLLSELTHAHNWEEEGAVSIADTVQAMQRLYDRFEQEEIAMVGQVLMWPENVEAPANTLPCDGYGIFLVSDYPALAAVLGSVTMTSGGQSVDIFVVPKITTPPNSGMIALIVATEA